MSIDSRAQTSVLTCPLCSGAVAQGSSGCRTCHLPMTDLVRHSQTSRRGSLGRALWVRLVGLVLYAAAVAWAAYQLPQTLPFVVPAAVLGGGVHVLKGRPWVGLAITIVVVVAVPLLLWPALGTGTFSDLVEPLGR